MMWAVKRRGPLTGAAVTAAALVLAACGTSPSGPNPSTVAAADCHAIAGSNNPVNIDNLTQVALTGTLAVDKHRFPGLYNVLRNLDAALTESGGTMTPTAQQALSAVTFQCDQVPGYKEEK